MTVFEIPLDSVYKPPEEKVKNSEKMDFLGTAKVIASPFSSPHKNFFTPEPIPIPNSVRVSGNYAAFYEDSPLNESILRLKAESLPSKTFKDSTKKFPSDEFQDKIKVKCHFKETRLLLFEKTDFSLLTLQHKISSKYEVSHFKIKYKDDDGDLITVCDQEDFDLMLKLNVQDRNKMELWCFEMENKPLD